MVRIERHHHHHHRRHHQQQHQHYCVQTACREMGPADRPQQACKRWRTDFRKYGKRPANVCSQRLPVSGNNILDIY